MIKKQIFWLFFIIPLVAWAAATTLNSSGNWSNSSIWKGGDIADSINEDVDFKNNIGNVTIQNGESYTTSVIAMNNGNTLTIDEGGSLNVGNASNADKLGTGNTATINVNGTLIIWGDLDVGNTLILNVGTNGSLEVKGSIIMGNGGSLDIQGTVEVDGDVTGGNNTDINVGGTLNIDGDLTGGNGSTLTGSGTTSNEGVCTGPPGFCDGGPLPVELIDFAGKFENHQVILNWSTATEINNKHFEVQISVDGNKFKSVEIINGNGTSTTLKNYEFVDNRAFSGQYYYRLKQVDYDGTIAYSKVILIKTNISSFVEFNVYPNPVNVGKILNLDLRAYSKTIIQIFDTKGTKVYNNSFEGGENTSFKRIQIETNNFSKGLYIIKVFSSGKHSVKRVKFN